MLTSMAFLVGYFLVKGNKSLYAPVYALTIYITYGVKYLKVKLGVSINMFVAASIK